MPSFEEEAFARAQQLHRQKTQANRPAAQANVEEKNASPQKAEQKSDAPQNESRGSEQPAKSEKTRGTADAPAGKTGLLDVLFRDKERSVILMLLALLADESTDPSLLLALVYLLM